MSDKARQPEKHVKESHTENTSEIEKAHQKLLNESTPLKATKSDSNTKTIQWPGGGKRTFERDKEGHIAKIIEKDGTYYEKEFGSSYSHKRHDIVISSGLLQVNEKKQRS